MIDVGWIGRVVVDRELGGREKSVGGQWSAVVDKGTGCGVCTVKQVVAGRKLLVAFRWKQDDVVSFCGWRQRDCTFRVRKSATREHYKVSPPSEWSLFVKGHSEPFH